MFAAAMNIYTTTWNDALSYSTPDLSGEKEGRISLFFKAIRGCSDDKLYEYLKKSSKEDIIDTIILCFNIRDCRGGKGEREIGKKVFTWLFFNHTSLFYQIYMLIPEYGRYDDLLWILAQNHITKDQENVQEAILQFYINQLINDKKSMLEGKPISLCAKWCPTENDSDDRKYKLVDKICKEMGISKKVYRKEYLSPLRSYLNIVEKFMCENRWDEIEYSKVPSCAIKKLKKAFEKHSPCLFAEWKAKLNKGEVKINASQLYPHELIKEIRIKNNCDEVCKAQWEKLVTLAEELGVLEDCIAVCDVSGSMETPDFLPLDVACGISILLASVCKGEFHNQIITFSEKPSFFTLEEGDLLQKYNHIRNAKWGLSTNIQEVFNMILKRCKKANVPPEKMPKKIIIISDMQFNVCEGQNLTNFELIQKKYSKSNYTRPNIVFWNVNGSSKNFPITVDDNGTCLISGFSPSIMKSVLETKEFDSYSIMRTTLDSERYKKVKDILYK